MTDREVAILNSLVTFAAENIPGGLNSGEQEVARKVGAWALDGIPVHQVCPHCQVVAPTCCEAHRGVWFDHHIYSRRHRWWWAVQNGINRSRNDLRRVRVVVR